MNILIGTLLIGMLAVFIWQKLPNREWREAAYRATFDTLCFSLPRIVVALLGAGFAAELLPVDHIEALFGENSGLAGIGLAVLLGPITPGGAFVSFAVGAAALKTGAALAQVLTYLVSWSLFSLTKAFGYEIPFVGRQIFLARIVLCLPVPFVVGLLVMSLS